MTRHRFIMFLHVSSRFHELFWGGAYFQRSGMAPIAASLGILGLEPDVRVDLVVLEFLVSLEWDIDQ